MVIWPVFRLKIFLSGVGCSGGEIGFLLFFVVLVNVPLCPYGDDFHSLK